jgi:hypothetical protein
MQPTAFLARLAALIPPPRHPLVRFHGAFAPHSAWRKKVVPAVPPLCAVNDGGNATAKSPRDRRCREAEASNAAVQLSADSPSSRLPSRPPS